MKELSHLFVMFYKIELCSALKRSVIVILDLVLAQLSSRSDRASFYELLLTSRGREQRCEDTTKAVFFVSVRYEMAARVGESDGRCKTEWWMKERQQNQF